MSPPRLRAAGRGDRRALLLACCLSALILVMEVLGGLWSGSLALLADAGHVLTDLLALLMAYFATVLAGRPADPRRTWGYHRLEILSALTNGVLLLAIAGVILWEAAQRWQAPRPVDTAGMVGVATLGLLANLGGVWLLSGHAGSLNVRSALWHLVGDTLSSLGVILAGLGIALTGWLRLDPGISVLIAAVVVLGALRVIREATDVLLESAPAGIDAGDVAAAIRAVDGVVEVHDLHIWCITTGMPALSGHVVVPRADPTGTDTILARIKELLRVRFDIEHTTIQVESEAFEEIGELH